jgi:retron-type reverse transcriptase
VGCYTSIHTVRKVVKFFNNRNSTINVSSIDLRKAFDKTNIFGILCLLQENNVNKDVINILENWFKKNSTSIKWNNVKSRDVPLMSGVKQGGILSPLLLTLYVNVILEKLEKSGIGCFIGHRCCNSYMYADDLILFILP